MAETREVRRLAPPPEIVSLEDMNIRLKRLNEGIRELIDLEKQNIQRLERLEKAVEEVTPEGIIVPRTITVTGEEVVDFRAEPLYSFSLYNDGEGDVYVGVNTYPEQEVPIHKRESYDCPIEKRGAIRTIYIVCESGKSATVRIYGVR